MDEPAEPPQSDDQEPTATPTPTPHIHAGTG